MPYAIAPSIKLDQFTLFVAETDRSQLVMCATVLEMAMNLARYQSMPADLRAVIDRNSGLELSGTMGRIQGGADVPARQKIVDAGVKVNVVPADELDRWRKATSSLEDQWAASVSGKGHDGKALIKSARELAQKHAK